MRRKDLFLLLAVLLMGFPLVLGSAEGLPRLEVSADRPSYLAGQTATVTLRTHAGGPSDVYLIMTTPTGRKLYADQALKFRRRLTAAAANFQVSEGRIEVPVSLATADLARPGDYKLEAVVTEPGAGPDAGEVVGSARFLVTIPGLNFLSIHDAESPQYNNDCGSCHADKTRDVFLAKGIPSFHTLKNNLFSAGGRTNSCTVCHTGADLIDESAAALRKQVSPSFCGQCHGSLGTGKRLFAK